VSGIDVSADATSAFIDYVAGLVFVMQDYDTVWASSGSGAASDAEVSSTRANRIAYAYMEMLDLYEGSDIQQKGIFYDLSGIVCLESVCDSSKVSWAPGFERSNVDYSDCDQIVSGSMCTPKCASGYSKFPARNAANKVNSFSAVVPQCDASGAFVDPTTWVVGTNDDEIERCEPVECTTVIDTTAHPLFDYGPCTVRSAAGFTGTTCFPQCKGGYTATSPATGFVLDCNEDVSAAPNSLGQFAGNFETGLVCGVARAVSEGKIADAPVPSTVALSPASTPTSTAAPMPASADIGEEDTGEQDKEAKDGANDDVNNGMGMAKGSAAAEEAKMAVDEENASADHGHVDDGSNVGMGMDAAAERDAIEGVSVDDGGMGAESAGGTREGAAAGLASLRGGSAITSPVAYAASGVGVVIGAAIIIAMATRHGLTSDRAPDTDVEEGFPLHKPGVHPVYA
jgi:hypothetical protein